MYIHPTLPPVLLAGTSLGRSPTASPAPARKGLAPKGSVLHPSQHPCLLPLSRGARPTQQKAVKHQKSTLQGAELPSVCHSHRATPLVSRANPPPLLTGVFPSPIFSLAQEIVSER